MAYLNGKRILNAPVTIVEGGEGYDEGYAQGKQDGVREGYESGRTVGFESGKEYGYQEGHSVGYTEGYDKGSRDGYEGGKADGYLEGKQDGYEEGKTDGYSAGKEAERTAFWETFQNGGKRTFYHYGFFQDFWNDDIYHPKYDIVSRNPNAIFQNSAITDTQKTVDLSGCVNSIAYTTFSGCTKLKTIRKLIVPAGLQYSYTFANCSALENITIEGEIGNSISFGDSPLLSDASLVSIIYHLATVSTTKTLTLHPDRLSTADPALIVEATRRGWDVIA